MFIIQSTNITTYAILIFLITYLIIVYSKPSVFYNRDGSLRQFGLNSSKRSIIPVWLLALLLALGSYILVFSMSNAMKV